MKKTVLSSRAPSTVSAYLRSLRRWKQFTDRHSNLNYFPAEPAHVALYLQHLLESTKSHQSVDAAFYAIKWAHNLSGLPSPTENTVVKLVVEGAKRSIGTRKVNRKEPLKLEHLNKIIAKVNLDNFLDLRNVCMYSLAFSALLRFDDLIRIRRSDLIFNTGHLKIVVIKSKNDQLREGNEVLILAAREHHVGSEMHDGSCVYKNEYSTWKAF
jgi:site-specific recombinase XerD